jgi:hypothetical protein
MQQAVRVVAPHERRGGEPRPMRRALAFAAIVAPARTSVKEPSTGLSLEAEHCVSRFACAQLLASGVRSKRVAGLANVKVYALGLYADAAAVKRALSARFKGKAASGSDVAEAVKDLHDVERNLQLVFARSVDGATVAGALSERLEGKVGKASPALATFKAAFAGAKMERGSVVNLSASRGGKLTVQLLGGQADGHRTLQEYY